jgi:hypothetical protein
LKPKWIIEGTWKIAQREKKDRYGSFTLKKKNEIEGLTIPEQVCSWRLSEFYATNLYNNARRRGSQSSSSREFLLGGKRNAFLF